MLKKLHLIRLREAQSLLNRKAVFGMALSLFVALQLHAQNRTVSGTVKSSDDNTPLPGVNVVVKGTITGTITDFNGKYSIEVNHENATLVFSYIGYNSIEVPVGNSSVVDIEMEVDIVGLEEVVVIGYGTKKKSDLTGAVSVVDADELNKVSSNDVTQMLQGRVAGVSINSDGQPGASPKVRIRGISTFGTAGTDAEPLYVVDGMPLNSTISTTSDGRQPDAQISSIRDLNPNDIESIQVLKDASAGAIYGVRAANGVVIITTKRGRFGQPLKVELNAYAGVQQVAKKIPVLHREQYQEIIREVFINDGQNSSPPIPPGDFPGSNDFIENIDTDWQEEGTKTGYLQDYNLAFSGGGSSTAYYASFDYFNNTGTLEGNGPNYKRYSIRLNTDTKKGDFRFGEKLFLTRTNENSGLRVEGIPGANPPFINDLIWAAPIIPVEDPNREGGYGGSSSIENSLSLNIIGMNHLVESERILSRALAGAYAEYDFIKGLTYKLNLQYDFTHQNDDLFVPEYDLGFFFPNGSAYFNKKSFTRSSGLVENTLSYNGSFGKHTLNLLGGVTFQSFDEDLMEGRTSQLQKPYVPTLANGTGTKSVTQNLDKYSIFSLLGRFDYSYDDRYFITANVRRDGSSKFGEDNRYAVLPSIAAAWKIHNDVSLPPFISELKLRGGIGQVGNQSIPSFGFQALLNSNITYSFNDERIFGAAAIGAVDPDLRWEVRTTRNVGLDMVLFDNLEFTAEYYSNKAEDIIVAVPIPLTVGALPASLLTNGGSMKNTGVEFSANLRQTIGDLYFEISPNVYTVKNEVLALGQGSENLDVNGARTTVGGEIGRHYGWVYDGIFQSQEEVDNHAFQNSATGPGDIRFKDLDGNDVIDDLDRTFIGDALPDVYYGLNLRAEYKGWDFTLFASGSAGAEAINQMYRSLMSSQASGNTNFHEDILDRWTPSHTNTGVPRMIFLDPNLNGRASDRPEWLQSTSYLRLNTVSFGYSLPQSALDKLSLTKARIYVTGQNLHTFTDYKGFNPDFQGISILSPGYDFGTYPRPRTMMIGLQLSF